MPDNTDLFGERLRVPSRKSKWRATPPRGYAAIPGTGPAGETCGSCAHLDYNQGSKRYYKCGLMRQIWTGGRGTDVLLRSPACRHWEEGKTDG